MFYIESFLTFFLFFVFLFVFLWAFFISYICDTFSIFLCFINTTDFPLGNYPNLKFIWRAFQSKENKINIINIIYLWKGLRNQRWIKSRNKIFNCIKSFLEIFAIILRRSVLPMASFLITRKNILRACSKDQCNDDQ